MNDIEFKASLTERRELAKTLGLQVIRTFTRQTIMLNASLGYLNLVPT